MSIQHLLNRTLTVNRPSTTGDGAGGQAVTFTTVGTVAAKVDQPTAAEREQAGQWGAELSHTVRFLPDADVARGDELTGGGQRFRVLATVTDSHTTYLKAPCELVQAEGA